MSYTFKILRRSLSCSSTAAREIDKVIDVRDLHGLTGKYFRVEVDKAIQKARKIPEFNQEARNTLEKLFTWGIMHPKSKLELQ